MKGNRLNICCFCFMFIAKMIKKIGKNMSRSFCAAVYKSHGSENGPLLGLGHDEFYCINSSVPIDVPEDHLAIYAGNLQVMRRYIIRTSYLNHPLFRLLLDEAEKEFGFEQRGVLRIPCEAKLIERLIWMLQTNDPALQST